MANTLQAVQDGVLQVQGTINGIGERCARRWGEGGGRAASRSITKCFSDGQTLWMCGSPRTFEKQLLEKGSQCEVDCRNPHPIPPNRHTPPSKPKDNLKPPGEDGWKGMGTTFFALKISEIFSSLTCSEFCYLALQIGEERFISTFTCCVAASFFAWRGRSRVVASIL